MAFPYGIVALYNQSLGTMVSQSRPLTASEVTALKNEYTTDPTGRGYAGKTAAQVLALMNSPYVVPNPQPQPTLTMMDKNAFFSQVLPYVEPVLINPANTLNAKYTQLLQLVNGLANLVTQIDLKAPAAQNLINQMVSDGLITSSIAQQILNPPDPSWQPQITMPPRSMVIFDVPLQLELSDITTNLGIS